MNSITHIITARKSVRSFTGESLSAAHSQALKSFIATLSFPFGAEARKVPEEPEVPEGLEAPDEPKGPKGPKGPKEPKEPVVPEVPDEPKGPKVRIELVSRQSEGKAVKLGTYGIISGATDFLLLVVEPTPLAEMGGGYMFEQVVLHATELGIGTCWLGGTFNRSQFKEVGLLRGDERLTIVSPVGYSAASRTLRDRLLRASAGSDARKSFGELFFNGAFQIPLAEAEAGPYKIPLEMVRLAPSAGNKQPWRVILKDGACHFYYRPGSFATNDIGIALCHFELTCQAMGLKGSFTQLTNRPEVAGLSYAMSWQ